MRGIGACHAVTSGAGTGTLPRFRKELSAAVLKAVRSYLSTPSDGLAVSSGGAKVSDTEQGTSVSQPVGQDAASESLQDATSSTLVSTPSAAAPGSASATAAASRTLVSTPAASDLRNLERDELRARAQAFGRSNQTAKDPEGQVDVETHVGYTPRL